MIRYFTILALFLFCLESNAQQNFENGNGIPKKFALHQNYPNPFNPSTTIKFDIPVNGNIKIVVFDLLGRSVKTLLNEFRNSGSHQIIFEANDLPAGIYFYKLSSGSFFETKRMILLK